MSTVFPPSPAKSRRHPGPLPVLMDQMLKIEQALQQSVPADEYQAKVAPFVQGLRAICHVQDQLNRRLWSLYNSFPAPHAVTHLGGNDNVVANINPAPLGPNIPASPGIPQAGVAAIGHVHDLSSLAFVLPLQGIIVDSNGDAQVIDATMEQILKWILTTLQQILASLTIAGQAPAGFVPSEPNLFGSSGFGG